MKKLQLITIITLLIITSCTKEDFIRPLPNSQTSAYQTLLDWSVGSELQDSITLNMLCLPKGNFSTRLATFKPFWVKGGEFYDYFDENSFIMNMNAKGDNVTITGIGYTTYKPTVASKSIRIEQPFICTIVLRNKKWYLNNLNYYN